MRNSIISDIKRCYVCGARLYLHQHHVLYGVKNRKKADEDGLFVYLCYQHHEGTNGVHGKNGKELDLKLKKIAEKKWLQHYNKSVEDFIARYGRNYL